MATPITRDLRLRPFLFYDDVAKAIDWLVKAFGLAVRYRLTLPNGVVAHAELAHGDDAVMVGNVGARNRARPSTVRSSV